MPATNMSSPFLERSTEAAMPEYTWSSVSNLPSTAAAWRGESADGGACAVEPERWWVRALPTEPLAASGLEPLPPMRRPLASLWGAGTRPNEAETAATLWLHAPLSVHSIFTVRRLTRRCPRRSCRQQETCTEESPGSSVRGPCEYDHCTSRVSHLLGAQREIGAGDKAAEATGGGSGGSGAYLVS